jgi:hypothetical protein
MLSPTFKPGEHAFKPGDQVLVKSTRGIHRAGFATVKNEIVISFSAVTLDPRGERSPPAKSAELRGFYMVRYRNGGTGAMIPEELMEKTATQEIVDAWRDTQVPDAQDR